MKDRNIIFRLQVCLLLFPVLCFARPSDHDEALTRLKGYARNVQAFNNVLPQEKVYLHFDNTSYFRGETIWFKAYVVRTDSLRLTDLSRVLYVELVAPTGEILQSRKLKIENGQARGEFPLDHQVIIDDGWYEVRAYTRYMTNWGGTGIFSRVFPIQKKPERAETKGVLSLGTEASPRFVDYVRTEEELNEALAEKQERSSSGTAVDIRSVSFYPEGGGLVYGLPSRVAFSVRVREDAVKSGLRFRLESSSGDSLGCVTTDAEGRGVFSVSPSCPVSRLSYPSPDGGTLEYPLPEPSTGGCVARVDAVSDSLSVRLSLLCTESEEGRLLGWMLQHEGRVLRFDTVRLSSSSPTEYVIPRGAFPAGVNQFTLFDRDGRILSDRLFFLHPFPGVDTEFIDVAVPDTIRPYGRLSFRFRTSPGRTFSFSVTDAARQVSSPSGCDVSSWLLLSSDVKGFIRRPDRYLESCDSVHRASADRLLMVQGWRRYDWRTMSGCKPFVKLQPLEDGLYIDGRILPLQGDGDPGCVGLDLVLMHPHKKRLWIGGEALTQRDGWFAFRLEQELEGRWGLVIHTKETFKDKAEEARNYRVLLNRQFSPSLRVLPWEEKRLSLTDTLLSPPVAPLYESYDSTLFPIDRSRMLQEVKVKRKKPSWKDTGRTKESLKREAKLADASLMYYDCEQIVEDLLDRGEEIPGMDEWLLQKPYMKYARQVEGRWLWGKNRTPEIERLSLKTQRRFDSGEILATNGLLNRTEGMDWLRSFYVEIPPEGQELRQIGFHRDFENDYISTRMGNGSWFRRPGDLMFYSYHTQPIRLTKEERRQLGRAVKLTLFSKVSQPLEKKGIRQTYFQGYNHPEVFHMNDYSQMEPVEDHRRTLYWNPDVTTDATGTATVTVWNSTSCRCFYLSAEGITQDGKPIMLR